MSKRIKFNPIPEYADVMDLDEFIAYCNSGGFIDYDGYGRYATMSGLETNLVVHPSDICKGRVDRRWGKVAWYNR